MHARTFVAALVLCAPLAAARNVAAQDTDAGVAPPPDAGGAPAGATLEDRVRALEAELAALHAQPHAGGTSHQTEADERLSAENASELTGTAATAPHAFTLGGYAEAFYQ